MTVRSRLAKLAYALGSAIVCGFVMAIVFPFEFVIVTMAIVLLHELGHWIAAHRVGATPSLPFFIPILIGALGATRVKNFPKASAKSFIALYGPLVGLASAIFFLCLGLILGNLTIAAAAGLSAISQIYWIFAGGDAVMYRKGLA